MKFSIKRPNEEVMTSAQYRRWQARHQLDGGEGYDDIFLLRERWIEMWIREAISVGEKMSDDLLRRRVASGFIALDRYDREFSDNGAAKGKLRTNKYNMSYCLGVLRGEIAHFIATGEILRHRFHVTQDANMERPI